MGKLRLYGAVVFSIGLALVLPAALADRMRTGQVKDNALFNEQDLLQTASNRLDTSTLGDTPDHMKWIGTNTYRKDDGEILAFPGLDSDNSDKATEIKVPTEERPVPTSTARKR